MEWLTHSQAGFRQSARYLLWMRVAIIAIALVAMARMSPLRRLSLRAMTDGPLQLLRPLPE